jgi:hypothetical protein
VILLPLTFGSIAGEGQRSLASMASSLSGHKPPHAEDDPDCTCFVCYEVLLDPVTLPCGHTLDQRCLLRVVATASSGVGQRACPYCRHPLPAVLPGVNIPMRNTIQQSHPEQVNTPAELRRAPRVHMDVVG